MWPFKKRRQLFRVYYRRGEPFLRPMNKDAWDYKNQFDQIRYLTWKNIADLYVGDLFRGYNFKQN